MQRFLLSVMALTVFAGGATGQQAVTGTVTDVHGDAIAGALVRCGDVIATTDRSGNFSISTCGTEIVVAAEGFETVRVPAARANAIVLHASALFAKVNVGGIETSLSGSPASVALGSADGFVGCFAGALDVDSPPGQFRREAHVLAVFSDRKG